MTPSAAPAYQALESAFRRLSRYEHVVAIASWDQAAMMPAGGNSARSEALAEMRGLCHAALADPSVGEWIERAEGEDLNSVQRASLREMRRARLMVSALPESLVKAKSLAGSACEHAWRSQRPRNDWAGFLANFKPVVAASRQEAAILSQILGVTPYEALMEQFEPGSRQKDLDALFGSVKSWLPGLTARAMEKQKSETVALPVGPFSTEAQRALGLEVMGLLGFDFDRGRLDVSAHPFCGGVPEDVRITTVYKPDDFAFALMGVVHETGHARYEQGLPRELAGLPVGRARSMGVHESQSLAFEMQLGASPAFLSLIAPALRRHLGEQEAFEPANLARLYTRVRATKTRLDADELTYPAHIILRYEIERDLINGEIEPEDIPALWDEKMMGYLGLDTRNDHANGAMQDIHWTDGSFGYFPSYSLGAMTAAQLMAAARRADPLLDQKAAAGDLSPMMGWLEKSVWSQASLWGTQELIARATGSELTDAAFKAHLEARYL